MSASKSKFCVSDVPPLLPGTTRHMQHQVCDGNLTNSHPLKRIPVNNISRSFFPPSLHCNGIWFVLEFRFILKILHSCFFNPLNKAYVESFVALSGFFLALPKACFIYLRQYVQFPVPIWFWCRINIIQSWDNFDVLPIKQQADFLWL